MATERFLNQMIFEVSQTKNHCIHSTFNILYAPWSVIERHFF